MVGRGPVAAFVVLLVLAPSARAETLPCAGEVDRRDKTSVAGGLRRAREAAGEAERLLKEIEAAGKKASERLAALAKKRRETEALRARIAKEQSGSPELTSLDQLLAEIDREKKALEAERPEQERRAADLRGRARICASVAESLDDEAARGGARRARIAELKGDVRICSSDDVCRKASANDSIVDGEIVATGKGGRAVLDYGEKHGKVLIDETSSVHVLQQGARGSRDFQLSLEITLGRLHSTLRCGHRQYYDEAIDKCRMIIKSHTAVAAVRGTEFDFGPGADGRPKLVPYDGKIELSADKAKSPGRWWAGHVPKASELPAAALGRVASLSGKAGRRPQGGAWSPLKGGELLEEGDLLETGADGRVDLILAGGFAGVLGPKSRFELKTTGGKEPAPVFGLWRGALYALRAKVERSGAEPRFVGPAVVAAVRGTEFELSIDDKGFAELTPYDGSIDVTADKKRLPLDDIEPWWKRF